MLRLLNFFIIVCLPALTACTHLFYQGDSWRYVDEKILAKPPEEVVFESEDHKKIHGWYFHSGPHPRGKILFFHGNAQNRSSHFYSLYWILGHHYDYLIFDYPGYGDSEGSPTQESTTMSGAVALNWLAKQEPQVPLILFGQSLGGNIAMYVAANHPEAKPCEVVVDSTFKSYRKVAQRVLNHHWFTWPLQGLPYLIVSEDYSASDQVGKISPVPLLVFHSEADGIVSINNGEDVFAAAQEPKFFYRVPEGDHIQTFVGKHKDEYQKILLDSFAKYCAPPSAVTASTK